MAIQLVEPFTERTITLQEDGEWTGEHVGMLRAARAVPIPPGEEHKVDPILAIATYVAKALQLEVTLVGERPTFAPLPKGAVR